VTDSDRLIRFVCIAASHRRTTDPGLTRYDGRWAICPELLARDHEWQDTGGLEVRDAVTQWRQLIESDQGPTQTAA
jgi:hypothetical protein